LAEKRENGSRQMKSSRIKKKELVTLTPGDNAEGRNEGNDDDDR
jgi:hypothetical protein